MPELGPFNWPPEIQSGNAFVLQVNCAKLTTDFFVQLAALSPAVVTVVEPLSEKWHDMTDHALVSAGLDDVPTTFHPHETVADVIEQVALVHAPNATDLDQLVIVQVGEGNLIREAVESLYYRSWMQG